MSWSAAPTAGLLYPNGLLAARTADRSWTIPSRSPSNRKLPRLANRTRGVRDRRAVGRFGDPSGTVLVLAVVGAAAVIAVFASLPGLTRVGLSDPGSVVAPPFLETYTVVYGGHDGLTVMPLDGHRGRYLLTTPTGPPLSASGGVAFVSGGMAYFLPAPYNGTPSPLVPALRVFPMVWPGLVGVERTRQLGDRQRRVREHR